MKIESEKKKDYKSITEYSRNYLLTHIENNDTEKLNYYLNEWKYRIPENLNDIFRNMIMHAQNRHSMSNSIGEIDKLSKCLFDFDPKRVFNKFNAWEEIFREIKHKCKPPGRMDITNSRSYWVIFCKSILSISKFLQRFESIDGFCTYIEPFTSDKNPDLQIALPLLLSEEIYGFGFALACDFIKENLSPKFIKPDRHIKDIFIGIGICEKDESDFDIFRKVINFSKEVNREPYWVDKLFFLIGSGKLYKTKKYKEEKKKLGTSKKELILEINKFLDNKN